MPNRLTKGRALLGSAAGTVFAVSSPNLATAVDRFVFVAGQRCQLISVEELHSVVGGASAAVRPRRIAAAAVKAPGAAADADIVELTAALDLTAAINTRVTPAIVAAAATFEPGDKLAEEFSGALTGLVGCLTYWFRVL